MNLSVRSSQQWAWANGRAVIVNISLCVFAWEMQVGKTYPSRQDLRNFWLHSVANNLRKVTCLQVLVDGESTLWFSVFLHLVSLTHFRSRELDESRRYSSTSLFSTQHLTVLPAECRAIMGEITEDCVLIWIFSRNVPWIRIMEDEPDHSNSIYTCMNVRNQRKCYKNIIKIRRSCISHDICILSGSKYSHEMFIHFLCQYDRRVSWKDRHGQAGHQAWFEMVFQYSRIRASIWHSSALS